MQDDDVMTEWGLMPPPTAPAQVRAQSLRKPKNVQPQITNNVAAQEPVSTQPDPYGPPSSAQSPQPRGRSGLVQQAQGALPGLYAEQEKAMGPQDYSGMQNYAKQRGAEGQHALLLSLAAQAAGKEFEPVGGAMLKRAMAARDPLKTSTGFITDQGEHIEDAQLRADQRLKQISAQIARNEQIIQSAATAEEKERAQQDAQQWKVLQFEALQEQRRATNAIAQQGIELRRDSLAQQQAAREATAATRNQGNATVRKEMAEAAGMEESLAGATEALRTASGGGTGWVAGMVQEKLPGGEALVGKMRDDPTKNAIQQMTYVTDAIRHARFGSALTATEKASAHQYLPSPYDDHAALIRKAEGLQDLIRENNRRIRQEFGRAGAEGFGPNGERLPQPGAPAAAPSVKQRAAGYLGAP